MAPSRGPRGCIPRYGRSLQISMTPHRRTTPLEKQSFCWLFINYRDIHVGRFFFFRDVWWCLFFLSCLVMWLLLFFWMCLDFNPLGLILATNSSSAQGVGGWFGQRLLVQRSGGRQQQQPRVAACASFSVIGIPKIVRCVCHNMINHEKMHFKKATAIQRFEHETSWDIMKRVPEMNIKILRGGINVHFTWRVFGGRWPAGHQSNDLRWTKTIAQGWRGPARPPSGCLGSRWCPGTFKNKSNSGIQY